MTPCFSLYFPLLPSWTRLSAYVIFTKSNLHIKLVGFIEFVLVVPILVKVLPFQGMALGILVGKLDIHQFGMVLVGAQSQCSSNGLDDSGLSLAATEKHDPSQILDVDSR